MKKVLTFAVIALGTAAVGLAISGPPRSAQTPASTPRVSVSADVAPGLIATTPNNAPVKYQPPSYDSGPGSGGSRGAAGFGYSSPRFRSGCSGGSCCP